MRKQENTKSQQYDVIVLGGGPSGMMAAGRAAERGKKVLLIEKNRKLGEKLNITGGGRCNITNAELDTRTLLTNYGDAEQFLFSPFSQFGVQDTFDFFESKGLPLVVEARKRAFPKTQNAKDVTAVMKQYLVENDVDVVTGIMVTGFLVEGKRITGVSCNTQSYFADSIVIALGGSSHPETGSTGDGFRFLKKLGHTAATASPDIVPLRTRDKWIHELSGTSLSFMKISFLLDGKKKFSLTGKILFTHFGLSGPLILNAAHDVKELLRAGEVTATIDCYPDTEFDQLERRIIALFDRNKNKDFKNIFKDIIPEGMMRGLLFVPPFDTLDKKVHSITKEERKAIVHALKALPLTITGLMGLDRAVVSDGGVPLSEVDTKTMSSRLYPNLFLTGDILNINRPSGGFSLQLCWTTGYVAGDHA